MERTHRSYDEKRQAFEALKESITKLYNNRAAQQKLFEDLASGKASRSEVKELQQRVDAAAQDSATEKQRLDSLEQRLTNQQTELNALKQKLDAIESARTAEVAASPSASVSDNSSPARWRRRDIALLAAATATAGAATAAAVYSRKTSSGTLD